MAIPKVVRLSSDFEDHLMRIYKLNSKSKHYDRVPSVWNSKDKSKLIKLTQFSLTATYSSHNSSESNSNDDSSFALHHDGFLYNGSRPFPQKFSPRLAESDVVGCGVDFVSKCLFFTRNGILIGKAFEGDIPIGPIKVYPILGLHGDGVRVRVNFGRHAFNYPFEAHITRERMLQEKRMLNDSCSEEFASFKMRDLISAYFVHHGYIASAQALSRWTSIADQVDSTSSRTLPSHLEPLSSSEKLASTPQQPQPSSFNFPSHSSDSQLSVASASLAPDSPLLPTHRRYSDPPSPAQLHLPQMPGLAGMIHRRQLRQLCRRSQYGKAVAILYNLYPQVLDKYPELLVHLRCRQFIEMMRRHALRGCSNRKLLLHRSNSNNSSSSGSVPVKQQRLEHTGGCRKASSRPKSGGSFSRQHHETIDNVSSTRNGLSNSVTQAGSNLTVTPISNNNGFNHFKEPTNPSNVDKEGIAPFLLLDKSLSELDETSSDDEEEDGGFGGIQDDDDQATAGPPTSNNNSVVAMDVDVPPHFTPPKAPRPNEGVDGDELRCVMRHIQFGRSLVNLVRQVRVKTGGLSLETERLLQRSVGLLAYRSPTSLDCPLRDLTDPVWREAIGNIINSAVLKAHDLPGQPTLEQGLTAFYSLVNSDEVNKPASEPRLLSHLLLYHLTPTELAEAELGRGKSITANKTAVTGHHQDSPSGGLKRRAAATNNNKSSNNADLISSGNNSPMASRRRRRKVNTNDTSIATNGHDSITDRRLRSSHRAPNAMQDDSSSSSSSSFDDDSDNSVPPDLSHHTESEDEEEVEQDDHDSEGDEYNTDDDSDDLDPVGGGGGSQGHTVSARRPNTRQTSSQQSQTGRRSSSSSYGRQSNLPSYHSNNRLLMSTLLPQSYTYSSGSMLNRRRFYLPHTPSQLTAVSPLYHQPTISSSQVRRISSRATASSPSFSSYLAQFQAVLRQLASPSDGASRSDYTDVLTAVDDVLKSLVSSVTTEDSQVAPIWIPDSQPHLLHHHNRRHHGGGGGPSSGGNTASSS